MRKRRLYSTGLVLFLCAAFFPLPGLAQPIVDYTPLATPVPTLDLALARPVAVGPVATGGPTLNVQVFAQFPAPMDVYFAIFAPSVVPTLFMVRPDNNIQPVSLGLVAWKSGVTAINNETPFGSIPTSAFPVATYQLLMALAPTGTLTPAALYRTSFGIGPVGDADADGIPDAVDAFPNDGLLFVPVTALTVPLNTPAGATFSAANSLMNVNADGFTRVAGIRDDATGNVKATTWDVDATNRVAAPPVTLNSIAGNNFSAAYDVSDTGFVVGESGKNGDTQFVAAIWSALPSPAVTELPGLNPAGNSTAYSISSQGWIVGEAEDAALATRAVQWVVGPTGTVLGGPGPLLTGSFPATASSAYFINDSGFVVGEVSDAARRSFAFLWKIDTGSGQLTSTVLLGDGTQEQSSIALGVSNDGTRVVGEFVDLTTGQPHAAEWVLDYVAGTVTRRDLGPAGGSLAAINQNEAPKLAGWSINFSGANAATVWDPRTTDPTLGQSLLSGVSFSQAYDINNQGIVVGTALQGAFRSAFLVITGQ
jgi:uncharacterized membrane protein